MTAATLPSQRCSPCPVNGQDTMGAQTLDGSLKDYAIWLWARIVTSRKCACECTWLCVWVCMWNRERKRDSVSCILWTPTDLSMGAIMSRSCNVISIRADFLSSPDKGVDTSTPHSEWVDHSNVSYLTHSHALIDGWQPVIVSW